MGKYGKTPAASKAVAKATGKKGNGKCNCWEGYDRAPGSKPCAPGSCVKAGKK